METVAIENKAKLAEKLQAMITLHNKKTAPDSACLVLAGSAKSKGFTVWLRMKKFEDNKYTMRLLKEFFFEDLLDVLGEILQDFSGVRVKVVAGKHYATKEEAEKYIVPKGDNEGMFVDEVLRDPKQVDYYKNLQIKLKEHPDERLLPVQQYMKHYEFK